MKKLAPIIIFTYIRLEKLKRSIETLKQCNLSKKSHLYIFSDFAKNKKQIPRVSKVRKYIKSIKGFKKVSIVFRKKNYGLTNNITDGVTKIINKHGKIIVMEEDIIVDKNFLNFLNQALDLYKNKNSVWHLSGWNYNLSINSSYDGYFTKTMSCWGWATWKNRWKYYEKNPKKITDTWSQKMVDEFNFDNSINFFSQILRNQEHKINTWAIFWYANIFANKKLCLNPTFSHSENIGIGKGSTHTNNVEEIFKSKITNKYKKTFKLPKVFKENNLIRKKIKQEIKKNKQKKILKRIKDILL
jgi:GT2 family glycosyltransferase